MKPARWACCSCLLMLLAIATASADTDALRPREARVIASGSAVPPAAGEPWQRVDLPASTGAPVAWYQIEFDVARLPEEAWSVFLPYLNTGGRLFLNGQPLVHIRESTADNIVRWERPHLVPIPPRMLQPGRNVLALRLAATRFSTVRLPLPGIGPAVELLGEYDARLFWTRTMSQFTVAACTVVGVLALFIWWRRREESLYGLFGGAALLWGLRTLTFVVEVLPSAQWHAWRTLYHGATGGFTIVMLLFAMRLADMEAGRLKWLLLGYWLLGPLGYLATGGNEFVIGRVWTAGLLPIGVALLAIAAGAAWRQRTSPLLVLTAALGLAVLAGFHDYLLASAPGLLRAVSPATTAQRLFLLHYAADVLLVAMGVILSVRLVGTLDAIQQLNRTLEARVAESEQTIRVNYERLRRLERQHAASQERQQIMRDLHDGLGSRLFVALSRAESGQAPPGELVQALRDCIADMRLTLEAMSPESNDFLEAWGDFRFRWQHVLEGCGLASQWDIETDDETVVLAPHVTLQLLRIVQEALTNVLKHAEADRVAIALHAANAGIRIDVRDNGRGMADGIPAAAHGLANMKARALGVGARLQIAQSRPGVHVRLDFEPDGPVT